jgi:hypothetical protein
LDKLPFVGHPPELLKQVSPAERVLLRVYP